MEKKGFKSSNKLQLQSLLYISSRVWPRAVPKVLCAYHFYLLGTFSFRRTENCVKLASRFRAWMYLTFVWIVRSEVCVCVSAKSNLLPSFMRSLPWWSGSVFLMPDKALWLLGCEACALAPSAFKSLAQTSWPSFPQCFFICSSIILIRCHFPNETQKCMLGHSSIGELWTSSNPLSPVESFCTSAIHSVSWPHLGRSPYLVSLSCFFCYFTQKKWTT